MATRIRIPLGACGLTTKGCAAQGAPLSDGTHARQAETYRIVDSAPESLGPLTPQGFHLHPMQVRLSVRGTPSRLNRPFQSGLAMVVGGFRMRSGQ